MELNHPTNRIHPLIAGAAVSVMLVSMLGVAAMTGLVPNSHGTAAETARMTTPASTVAPAFAASQPGAIAAVEQQPAVVHQHAQHLTASAHSRPPQLAQAEPVHQYAPAPVLQPRPAVSHNSPVGIGIGAVVGGLLGNQVGRGNGRTLATIAGAIGGGYVGNEIAQRYP